MKYFILFVVLAIGGAGVYGYTHNPQECAKLGNDLKAKWPAIQADLVSIYINNPQTVEGTAEPPPAQPQGGVFGSANHAASQMAGGSIAGPVARTYDEALAQSKGSAKNMLLIFDGSDWSMPSQLFDKEVLSTIEWGDFSKTLFIPIQLEVAQAKPGDGAQMSPNQRLAARFGVTTFPTVMVVSPGEREVKRYENYGPGMGPDPVMDELRPYAK
jgi:hypothetical protein